MEFLPAILIGILITAPTGLAILICSRGNAADWKEIARLNRQIETLEQQRRTDLNGIMATHAAHAAEIASLKKQHEAELVQMGAANATEFARGVEWERKRPEREARNARSVAKMEAEHAKLRAEWS